MRASGTRHSRNARISRSASPSAGSIAPLRGFWQENRSEGASLYFLDPDGHKLEIHAGDWQTRLAAMKQDPWEPDIEYFA
jgi:hypothetical protein